MIVTPHLIPLPRLPSDLAPSARVMEKPGTRREVPFDHPLRRHVLYRLARP